MNRGKIRLRPTGLWILFGPILGCMWLAAVNYSNNLVYGVLYLVGSLTFISVFHTWRNLAALEVEHVRVHSAFAGGKVRVDFSLRNPAKHPLYGLFLVRVRPGSIRRSGVPLVFSEGGPLRLNPGESRLAEFHFHAERRGSYPFDSVLIRSSYPFGLVTASFRLVVGADYFVYPNPAGQVQFPQLRPGGEDGLPASPQAGDDFGGVRPYTPGESLRHVDWKAYARGRPLSVKQFTGGEGRQLWFDAAGVTDLPVEQRLSQLTLWIVRAEKEEIPYVLRLGSTTLPLGLGVEQSRRALELLAVAE
jgi:uncharacterized protein (DUF58 family)